jgi:hypothetical protein
VYRALMVAGDQTLVDLRLSSMINYADPCGRDHNFLHLVEPHKYRFRLRASVTSRQWIRLLDEMDVLLYRRETNFVVQLYQRSNDDDDDDDDVGNDASRAGANDDERDIILAERRRRPGRRHHPNHYHQGPSRRNLDCQRSEFLVHADRTVQAIFHVQRVLSGAYDDDDDGADPDAGNSGRRHQRQHRTIDNTVAPSGMAPSLEAFSVYFETTEPIPPDHHQLIERLGGGPGGSCVTRTCADAAEYQTEGYTVRAASPDVLARALRPIHTNNVLHCSLRIDHPSPDTLGRFINACRGHGSAPLDYPSTLGMDAAAGRYFCRKSIRDVLSILEYLADYSTTAEIGRGGGGDFEIWELSSSSGEDGPF